MERTINYKILEDEGGVVTDVADVSILPPTPNKPLRAGVFKDIPYESETRPYSSSSNSLRKSS